MRVELVVVVCVATVALSLPALSTCDPLYVMLAPNLLRVGSPEKVFVEAQDYRGNPLQVRVCVLSFPTKNIITEQTVTLNQENDFQNLAKIRIPPELFADAFEDEYVYLQAHFPNHKLEKMVLLSFQSGYIFLQTDKPIYKPSDTVLYRIFALGMDLKPTNMQIQVDIMSPKGVEKNTTRHYLTLNGYTAATFRIPSFASSGTWKIVAMFFNNPKKTFTAEFEVKEYVLPTFEIFLTPKKNFYYVEDNKMEIDIRARYIYGKEVTGVGFVTFGVLINGQKSLPYSLQQVKIRDGVGEAILKREHITAVFPNMNDIVDSSIYVHVSVLTEIGSEVVDAERHIQVVTSPYTIQFKRTPKYFKPGMPFHVTVYVSNPEGSPAPNINVVFKSENERKGEARTGKNGIATITINTRVRATSLLITANTKVPELTDAGQAMQQMTALPYQTKTGSQNYLHIEVPGREWSVGDQLKIVLGFQSSSSVQEHDFTLLVLNRGHIVEAKRFKRMGHGLLIVYLLVTKDMVPSIRIVAYYHVGSSEVVSDSVWLDVKETCMGTLKMEVTRPFLSYKPRQRVSLKITGDPGARVGLLAVDKGVYVLNNKHRLTQTKIWKIIEEQDTGCTAGSGKDSMGVFYDAGLAFQTSTAGGTDIRQVPSCPSPANRRRRDAPVMEVHTTVAKTYLGEIRRTIVDRMKKKTLSHRHKRHSDEAEEEMDEMMEEVISRSRFPESWHWNDLMLPSCLDCDTASVSHTFFPDSITSWQFSAISISDTEGVCVAETLNLAVSKNFFIDLKLPYSAVRNEQIEIRAILHNNMEESIRVRVELHNTENVCTVSSKTSKQKTTVELDGFSTLTVPFVIVPMGEAGKYTIWVKAMVYDMFLSDGIRKDLLVVPVPVRPTVVDQQPSNHVCGQRSVGVSTRIVGGKDAIPGAWPWQASIHRNGKHTCGGSLINKDWVMTAAHCFDSIYGLVVYLGRQSQQGSNRNEISRTVSQIISHPDYNIETSDNDIALLRLSSSVSFTNFIRPICLAAVDSTFPPGTNSWVTGWGSIKFKVPLPSPQTLQEVEVPIVGNRRCSCQYSQTTSTITDNMICAGSDEGGKDSCQGDSGGPMMSKHGSRWVQSGIVSFGKGCGKAQFPGVYTRVSQYQSWINSQIGSDKSDFIPVTSTGTGTNMCQYFHLDVNLTKEAKVGYQHATESYLLTVDLQSEPNLDSAVVILDVSLLDGYVVNDIDLLKTLDRRDYYIHRFEKHKPFNTAPLIIYLSKSTNCQTWKETITFKLHKVMDVGWLQPAAVTVYDKHNTENRCVKFYHPVKHSGDIAKLCLGDTCMCVEGMCSKQRKTDVEKGHRGTEACQVYIDYVIKATILEKNVSTTKDVYRIRVANIIKLGTDAEMTDGSERSLIARPDCREQLDLQVDKSYLIMGAKEDIRRIDDKFLFLLGEKTWIEYWPTETEAQDPVFRKSFKELEQDAFELMAFGCIY